MLSTVCGWGRHTIRATQCHTENLFACRVGCQTRVHGEALRGSVTRSLQPPSRSLHQLLPSEPASTETAGESAECCCSQQSPVTTEMRFCSEPGGQLKNQREALRQSKHATPALSKHHEVTRMAVTWSEQPR